MKYLPFIGNLFLLFALPALADQGERMLAADTSTCTVGVDCCTGGSACTNAGRDGSAVIKSGSCDGSKACHNAGRDAAGSASIGVGSCKTGGFTCQNVGRGGLFEAGDGSCIGTRACSQGARDTGSHLKIGAGSCKENTEITRSCEWVAMQGGSVDIGDNSCLGNYACRELGLEGKATVGNDSCLGKNACKASGKYDGEIHIGNGSCKANHSCMGLAQHAAEGYSNEIGKIVIGDDACNCKGCCGCLRPGDVVPNGMCNELGNEDEHCCVEVGDRNPFGPLKESNLCVEEQDKCLKATVSGDPHITTFSGLKYDCMGQGEFILSKSQSESDPLEIRGLFVDPNFAGEVNPWENNGSPQTVTRGVAFIVDDDVPMIRITTDPEIDVETCSLYFYVEGVGEVSFDAMLQDSTLIDRTQVKVSSDDKQFMTFMFHDYDALISVSVEKSKSGKWGCVMKLSACLKPLHHGDVLGLFGTNNPYRDDDWTTRDGTQLQVPMRPKEGAGQGLSSQYCLDNWCYEGPEGNPAQGSFFSDADFNYYSRCDQSPYSSRYNETAMEEMLEAMRESCAEEEIFHITSEVLYDAAVQYHITNPDDTDCPVELIEEAERVNAIAFMKCWTAPTPAPVRLPTRNEVNPPTPTGTGGDPHFHTWKNEHFEYHGQCDLTLVKDEDFADGRGLDIQIRTKVVRYWSYIKNAAIRIGNDILEIEGTADLDDPKAHYWINFEYQGDLDEFAGFPVTQEANAFYKRKFHIDLSSKYPGTSITIQILKEFLTIKFDGDHSAYANSVGLLGDSTTGKTLARDGVTEIHDYAELGDEWQVLPSEPKLFHKTDYPQFPEPCIKADDPRGDRRRRLSESNISLEEAEAACSSALADAISIKDCIYDILATQDLDMVGAF